MGFFKEFTKYIKLISHYLGKTMTLSLVFLTLVIAAFETLGVSMLFPLLKTMEKKGISMDNEGKNILLDILSFFNIPLNFSYILIFIGSIFLIKGILKLVEAYLKAKMGYDLVLKLKLGLIKTLGNVKVSYFIKQDHGHFTNLVNTQTDRALIFFNKFILFTGKAIIGLFYLVVALWFDWIFTLMALLLGTLVLLIFKFIAKKAKRISFLVSEENSTLNGFFDQILYSLKYLIATDRFGHLYKKANNSVRKLGSYRYKLKWYQGVSAAINEPLSVIFIISLIFAHNLFFGGNMINILVTLILLYRAINTFMTAQQEWQATMSNIGAVEMVNSNLENIKRNSREEKQRQCGSPFEFKDRIDFKDVNFSYSENEELVLKNINLTIKKNEAIGLVGESGAGKSTLADLMMLVFQPTSGQILIDGTETSQISPSDWRSHFGYVPQEVIIFNDTVSNNICLWEGDPVHDKECRNKIEAAAQKAHCLSFIKELEHGFHTQIGERGVKLSGGQKQRLAIAREIYKKPGILLLDEATSALDSSSEKAIQKSIDELRKDMTIMIIAHRLSTIKNMDRIVVLEKGVIKEVGDFDSLISDHDSLFKKMTDEQKL